MADLGLRGDCGIRGVVSGDERSAVFAGGGFCGGGYGDCGASADDQDGEASLDSIVIALQVFAFRGRVLHDGGLPLYDLEQSSCSTYITRRVIYFFRAAGRIWPVSGEPIGVGAALRGGF